MFTDDDIPFTHLEYLCKLHHSVAANEHMLGNDESTVKEHLTLATKYAIKNAAVKESRNTSALVCGIEIPFPPADKLRTVRGLREELSWPCFGAYRETDWFCELIRKLDSALQ